MKKEAYLPPEVRALEMTLDTGILILSGESSTIEDYYYEDLDNE